MNRSTINARVFPALERRRGKQRFQIEQDVSFRILDGKEKGRTGRGRTIELSSRGVRLTTDRPLPLGAPVELSIDWPILLDGRCLMKLVIGGTVLRQEDTTAVVSVRASEFR